MLPLGYLLRNLLRRRLRTLATVLGIAATTVLVVAMHAFASGLVAAGRGHGAGRSDVVLLLGVSAEVDLVRSVVARGSAELAAAAAPGVLVQDGQRAASVELHIASRSGDQVALLRGVTDAAFLVHPHVQVIAGHEPRGPFELMVGPLAAARMGRAPQDLAVGAVLRLEGHDFRIVGHFAAPGHPVEAELWARLPDLMLATKREDVSCVVLRLVDAEQVAAVQLFAGRRLDLEIAAVKEADLQRELVRSIEPLAVLARWMALLAVLGGAFACANTMFAAVLARTREFGTLRALGYSPLATGVAVLLESLLVAGIGGGIGVLAALYLSGVPLRYPMGALRLDADAGSRLIGLGAALASGLLGGIVPAVRVVRLPLLDALGGRV